MNPKLENKARAGQLRGWEMAISSHAARSRFMADSFETTTRTVT
jgi:hypothetical protein